MVGLARPVLVTAVLTTSSCCRTRPSAVMRACRPAATWACARVTSMGARVPSVDLVLIVLVQPFGKPQRLLFHFDVFVQTYEIGVEAGHAGNRVNHLLAKYQVGDLLAPLRDANVSSIHADSKASQERLCDREVQGGSIDGVVSIVDGVRSEAAIVEVDCDLRPRRKALEDIRDSR